MNLRVLNSLIKMKIISQSDAILQMNIISDENLDKFKQNQIFIGVLNPF